MLKFEDKLVFEPISEYIIDSYINSILEKPYRGNLYTLAQQSKIRSIAYSFERIEHKNYIENNEIAQIINNRIAEWDLEMSKLLGRKLFVEFLDRRYGWHPFEAYSTWSFKGDNGIRCEHGTCNFNKKKTGLMIRFFLQLKNQ